MIPIEPAVFLHPAQYHGGGVAFFPIAVFVLGIGLFAFGAWQLYRAAEASGIPERSGTVEPSGAADDATDSPPDR